MHLVKLHYGEVEFNEVLMRLATGQPRRRNFMVNVMSHTTYALQTRQGATVPTP